MKYTPFLNTQLYRKKKTIDKFSADPNRLKYFIVTLKEVCCVLTNKMVSLPTDEEDLPEAQFSHQINQGERPTFDPINLSSTLYHLNMAKRLMREKSAADWERHTDSDLNCVSTFWTFIFLLVIKYPPTLLSYSMFISSKQIGICNHF